MNQDIHYIRERRNFENPATDDGGDGGNCQFVPAGRDTRARDEDGHSRGASSFSLALLASKSPCFKMNNTSVCEADIP